MYDSSNLDFKAQQTISYPTDPWFSIWNDPRGVIRAIVKTDVKRHVNLLIMISGAAGWLGQSLDETNPLVSLAIGLIIGPILGLISVTISTWIMHASAQFFGGNATHNEVRAAIAWGSVPNSFLLLLYVPYMLITALLGQPILVGLVSIIQFIIGMWSALTFWRCFAEVNGFSTLKAFWVALAPSLLILAVIILFAGLFSLA